MIQASNMQPQHSGPTLSVPLMVNFPVMLPSPSPECIVMQTLKPALQPHCSVESQLCGDWSAFADSRKSPRVFANNQSTPTKRIYRENGVFKVQFSDIPGSEQFYQIQVFQNGQAKLCSPSNPGYSFLLLPPQGAWDPNVLSWGSETDPGHVVSWKRIASAHTVPPPTLVRMEDSLKMHPSLNSNASWSRRSSMSSTGISSVRSSVRGHVSCSLSPLPAVSEPVFIFPAPQNDDQLVMRSRPSTPQGSRANTPEPELPEDSPELSMHKRDSKQTLVNKVEPAVDELIGHLYAKKEDYRLNQSGRHGPPVLRGEDVLFIPAKKQAALENVVELIRHIQATCTVVAASKVCQKKKKRQKKGFLVYLQLASATQVKNFLRQGYPHFESTVQGVKTAIFAKDK